MIETSYTVSGMSCEHCGQSVTEEITKIAGVTNVTVDVPSGSVVVTSSGQLSDDDVRAAVDEAGYQVA